MKVKSEPNIRSFKEEKSLSDFIHRVGHDIGNPLTSLISLASLLERSTQDLDSKISREDSSRYLKSIIGDAWRVQALVEKSVIILSDRNVEDDASTDVGEVIQYVVRKLLRRADFQRFDIIFTPPLVPVLAKVGRSQIEWLVIELLTNSMNHLSLVDTGHENPVCIRLSKGTEGILLEVENSFLMDYRLDLKSLFEPFIKIPDTSRGAGLGLTAASLMLARVNAGLFIELDENRKSFVVTAQLPSV